MMLKHSNHLFAGNHLVPHSCLLEIVIITSAAAVAVFFCLCGMKGKISNYLKNLYFDNYFHIISSSYTSVCVHVTKLYHILEL